MGDMRNTSYVRNCAMHHTFNRAFAIHGTQGVTLANNVAYDVMGHAFFTEDGNEFGNTITGNLGLVTRASQALLNTDTSPATFWIVHPNNTVSGNHAAGAHGAQVSFFADGVCCCHPMLFAAMQCSVKLWD